MVAEDISSWRINVNQLMFMIEEKSLKQRMNQFNTYLQSIISISKETSFGIVILIMLWRTLSSTGRSIILLWTLISHLSKVALPSPQGLLRVVILSLFVGNGIGPHTTTPDLLAISLIAEQISFKLLISILAIFILAFDILSQKVISKEGIKIFLKKEKFNV